MKIELVVIAAAIARVRFPVRLLCAGYVFWQQRLKHSPKLQWRTKILGTVMENLPSTSLTYQMFRYRDWSTPPPSKQCWGEETLLGQGKGYRGAQTTTLLGGDGERGKN